MANTNNIITALLLRNLQQSAELIKQPHRQSTAAQVNQLVQDPRPVLQAEQLLKLTQPQATHHNSQATSVEKPGSSLSSQPKTQVTAVTEKSHNISVPEIITIKVFNPDRKRDTKIFKLHLQIDEISSLKCLREEILEQLGKGLLSMI